MDRHARQQVVVSDRVAVFEEDSVVGNLLLGRRHVRLLLNLLLHLLNRVAESDVDGQRLTIQLPFGLVRNVRNLNLNRNRALKSGRSFE